MTIITEDIDHHAAIYRLAKAGKFSALKKYLEKYPDTLDTLKAGTQFLSAAARLAKENEHEAVKILLALGARPDLVVYGAALGGHHHLISKDNFIYRTFSMRCKQHEKFVQLIKSELDKYRFNTQNFVPASADIHNEEHAIFRALVKSEGIELPALFVWKLPTLGSALNEGIVLIDHGKMNWSDLTAILCKGLNHIKQDFKNWAALGSAESGNYEYIKIQLQEADANWLAIGAVRAENYIYAEKMRLLYKEKIIDNVIKSCVAKDFVKAAQLQAEYKTFHKELASYAQQNGNLIYADELENKSTILDVIPSSTLVDEWLNTIDATVIALAVAGIESLSIRSGDQQPSFWSVQPTSAQEDQRAHFYKEALTANSEAMPTKEKLTHLYALLASNQGEKLKRAVSKALMCDTPKEASHLTQRLLIRDSHTKEAIAQLNTEVAKIVHHANTLHQKGETLSGTELNFYSLKMASLNHI